MKPAYIYALIDPRDDQIRYVGKTIMAVEQRLAVHVSYAKSTHTHSARWICGLLSEGLKPRWVILETVVSDWQSAEKQWIATLKAQGMSLTNLTSGGDGIDSYKHSDAARLKMSVALKLHYAATPHPWIGRKKSPEAIEKTAIAHRGKPKSEDHKQKLSEAQKRVVLSAETRAKISAANKGRPKPPRSPEHCQRIAARHRGSKASVETRKKMSLAKIGRKFSDAHMKALRDASDRRYATVAISP